MNPLEMIAVYGTLRKGYGNHSLLARAQFLGRDSLQQICLYDIGPYPAARLEASEGIEVEVYTVTPSELACLDLLEEYDPSAPQNSLYTRELLATRFGFAWVYLYQMSVIGRPCLRSGAWHALDYLENEE